MRKQLFSSLLLTTALLAVNQSNAQCDCGDGSDGAYSATSNTTLAGGTYYYTTFNIDAGVTVTATGSAPLIIHCTGNATINGTLSVSGANGTDGITFSSAGIGGIGVAGGYNGADGVYIGAPNPGNPGFGPGAGGLGTNWGGGGGAGHGAMGTDGQTPGIGGAGGVMYGNIYLVGMDGGSGGGSGSGGNSCGSGGGGAGGGILVLRSCDTIMIGAGGGVTSNGGNGGSDGAGNCGGSGGGAGGSLWLLADHLTNDGTISATGGTGGTSSFTTPGGAGAEGRVRLDMNTTSGTGVVSPPAGLTTTVFTTTSTFVSPTCVGGDGSAETVPSGSAGTYTYLWDGGGMNDTIMGLVPGSYTVTVTDTNGCTVTDTVDVTGPIPVGATMSSTDETTTTASDGTATASGTGGTPPYTYLWSPGGGTTSTITGLDTGWYVVVVTDTTGCTGTDSVYVGQATSVSSVAGANDFVSVYPNPANSYVTINAVKAMQGTITVQLTDITGRTLATETFQAYKEHRINTSAYPAGNYLLRITGEGMSQNAQLTIIR